MSKYEKKVQTLVAEFQIGIKDSELDDKIKAEILAKEILVKNCIKMRFLPGDEDSNIKLSTIRRLVELTYNVFSNILHSNNVRLRQSKNITDKLMIAYKAVLSP